MCKPDFMCAEMIRPEGAKEAFGELGSRGLASQGNLWAPGQTITIRFIDGASQLQTRLRNYAEEWLDYANVKFLWVDHPNRESNIRISLNSGSGSWSYVAHDALLVYADKPTMNFGWFEWAINEQKFDEARRVVLHEFGHMLGMQHEQISPVNNIPWNESALFEFYKAYNWKIEDVRKVYSGRFEAKDPVYSRYDPLSIMHYPVEDKFTYGTFTVPYNYEMSQQDKDFIAQLYPKTGL
jgi:hypothetical protein